MAEDCLISKDSLHFLSLQPLLPVQGSADVLQNHELTARVIGHLDSLRDIIVCSAVSKSWHNTVSKLAPTSLVIPGHDANLTVIATARILYWVQQKQHQGHLQDLHTLSVLLLSAPDMIARSISVDELVSFGQAVIAFAGLWPLTRTTLVGPFKLTQVVLLLPTTLQSLHVRVGRRLELDDDDDDSADNISLALFKGLESLRFLHLEFVGPARPERTFELDTALLNLQCLHVSPCTTTCYDDLAQLLPNLTHVALVVRDLDAQEFADLPCIQYLCLGLIHVSIRLVSFVVKADSSLRELRMVVALGVTINIEVQKSDLCYNCCGNSWAISKAATQGIACKMPKDFQPISCHNLKGMCWRGP